MSKPKVRYNPGFVTNSKGKQITSQEDAWEEGAKCGCGIDCCNQELVLTDKNNGTKYALFFENGGLKFRKENGAVVTLANVV